MRTLISRDSKNCVCKSIKNYSMSTTKCQLGREKNTPKRVFATPLNHNLVEEKLFLKVPLLLLLQLYSNSPLLTSNERRGANKKIVHFWSIFLSSLISSSERTFPQLWFEPMKCIIIQLRLFLEMQFISRSRVKTICSFPHRQRHWLLPSFAVILHFTNQYCKTYRLPNV